MPEEQTELAVSTTSPAEEEKGELLETSRMTHRHRVRIYEMPGGGRQFEVKLANGATYRRNSHSECMRLAQADVAVERLRQVLSDQDTRDVIGGLVGHFAPENVTESQVHEENDEDPSEEEAADQ